MKNSFVMYNSYIDQIDLLSREQRGDLLTAIFSYSNGLDLPEMDSTTQMAFSFIKTQMDKDIEKYNETIEKRSEAGKISGKVRAEKAEQKRTKQTSVNSVKQKGTKRTVYVDVDVNEDVDECEDVVVNDVLKDENKKKESTLTSTKERFRPPTVDEVSQYAAEKGMAIDAEHFVDFYASKGWMVGKNKMKDWKACVRNWSRQDRQGKATKPSGYMDAIANRVKVVDEW